MSQLFKHLPCKDRLSKLGLPTLVYRRLHGDGEMIEVFKILSGIYDNNAVPVLCSAVAATTRGHNKKLFKPFSRKKCTSEVFKLTVQVIDTWNSLPHDIVDAQTVNLFKIDLINTG